MAVLTVAATACTVPIAEVRSPNVQSFSGGAYYMACVAPSLAGGQTEGVLELKATVSVSADGSTFFFAYIALENGVTDPTRTTGSPSAEFSGPISGASADVDLGYQVIPWSANPYGATDIEFTSLKLHLLIGPGTDLCAQVSGQVDVPVNARLSPPDSVCTCVPLSNPLPTLEQSDVHCP
jgi:hypothetical protein